MIKPGSSLRFPSLLNPIRSGPSLRLHELMASASMGTLFRSERQSWPRDKPFIFDIVAASALCERPELELCSLVVGLSCVQHLVSRLQGNLAAAVLEQQATSNEGGEALALPWAAASAAVAAASGADKGAPPAPLTAKQVQAEVVVVAARLEAIAREAQTPDVMASPHLKEWVGRAMRMCGAIACYEPPVASASSLGNQLPSVSETDGAAPDAWASGGAAGRSSDSSSDDGSYKPIAGIDDRIMMPMAYGRPRAPPPPAQQIPLPTLQAQPSALSARPASLGRGSMRASAQPSTVQTTVPPPPYLSRSCVGDCLWGYPFSGPRTSILFGSKRSKRQRALLSLLGAARQQIAVHKVINLRLETAEATPAASATEQWQELSGPADPLLIRGHVLLPGSKHQLNDMESGDSVTVVIEASARLDCGAEGAELHIRTAGPAVAERRGVVWKIPRMMSVGDKVQRSFALRLLGYGPAEVTCCVQLYAPVPPGETTSVQLLCRPLKVSMVGTLRPAAAFAPTTVGLPLGGFKIAQEPSAADFFRLWSALPARAEISGATASDSRRLRWCLADESLAAVRHLRVARR